MIIGAQMVYAFLMIETATLKDAEPYESNSTLWNHHQAANEYNK